jgi:hypothetical protein
MPRFMIERNFSEQLESTREGVAALTQVNANASVQWLFSFLSADKKKTYCLYEAPSAEAIREAARRLNISADVIIEVSDLRPEQVTQSGSRSCEGVCKLRTPSHCERSEAISACRGDCFVADAPRNDYFFQPVPKPCPLVQLAAPPGRACPIHEL